MTKGPGDDTFSAGTPPTWRLLPYHVGSSTLHFALSDALVRLITTPTVWWHSTERPSLILGPGQKPDRINLAACDASGVLVLSRQAGGTAIYAAAGVLGLDVALPLEHPLALSDVVEAYRWIGEVWVAATRRLGADARLVSIEEARQAALISSRQAETLRLACFGTLSPYEVVVGARKLVGLSQVRRRQGVLLQGGIHLVFHAQELARSLAVEDVAGLTSSLSSAAIGLHEATADRPDDADVRNAFAAELERLQGVRLAPGVWSSAELQLAEQRLAEDGVGRSDRLSLRQLPT